jgi:hypothetical protein
MHAPGINWGDSTLQTHVEVAEQWHTEVLQNPKFEWGLYNATTHHRQPRSDETKNENENESGTGQHPSYYHYSAVYDYDANCEAQNYPGQGGRVAVVGQSWLQRLYAWFLTPNADEVGSGGEDSSALTGSDFLVLFILVCVVGGLASVANLYFYPSSRSNRRGSERRTSRRASRGGYEMI